MIKTRKRVKHLTTFEERLAEEAIRFRAAAEEQPPGSKARELLLRRARSMNRSCKAPLLIQVADVLQRARKLPAGPAREDLQQLAQRLLKLQRKGLRANVEIVKRRRAH